MTKNKEIAELQKKQKTLKKEVSDIKKKLPKYIIGFVLLTFVGLYLFEDNFYDLFGNGVDIIKSGVIISGIICFFLISTSYLKINKKKKEAKILGAKLYNMMRLDDNSSNNE